ncbi:MAG: TonB-dependent receptor [Alphaproteobacteria bacterium]
MRECVFTGGLRRRAVMAPFALVPALVIAMSATDVSAQTNPEGAGEDVVVVTASPILSDRFDILQGTSILEGEDLERRRAPTLGETLRLEPGVSSSFFGPGSSRPIIRGQGGPRVEVLRNGIGSLDLSVTSADHLVLTEPLAAETIEVVRGPAALRFGSSAAGGVVNVLDSSIPRALFERPLSAVWRGSYATVNDARETAGLVEGNAGPVALHLDGWFRDTDDFEIPGFARSAALRALEPPEPGEEEPFGFVENSFIESFGGTLGASRVFADGYLGAAGTFNDFSYGLPGVHEHEEEEEEEHGHEEERGPVLDGEQTRIDVGGGYSFGHGFLEEGSFRLGYADYEHAELEGGEVGTRFTNEEWEGRAEVTHRPAAGIEGAFGFQVNLRDFSAVGEEAVVPPNETFQWGVFVLEKYTKDRWDFSAGARYEHTDVDGSFANGGGPPVPVDLEFDAVSGTLGAAFRPADGWLVGAFGYRTERAPSAEELLSNGPHLATGTFEIGQPGLGKETALGVEGTVRYRTGRFTTAVNAYYTSYDGFIFQRAVDADNDGSVDVEDGLPVFRFAATNARFTGFEAEAQARLWQGGWGELRADTVLDYVDAEDGAGEPLPRIPPFRWLAGLEAAGDRMDVRAEVQWVSAAEETAFLELPTDSYALVNAYLDLRPLPETNRVEIALDATNLLDEEARVHTSFLKDEVPLPGRSFRVRLIMRY